MAPPRLEHLGPRLLLEFNQLVDVLDMKRRSCRGCAVADWRAANTVENGVALGVLADHLASLAPGVYDRAQTIVDLSPTLRAAMRQVEARQAPKREVA